MQLTIQLNQKIQNSLIQDILERFNSSSPTIPMPTYHYAIYTPLSLSLQPTPQLAMLDHLTRSQPFRTAATMPGLPQAAKENGDATRPRSVYTHIARQDAGSSPKQHPEGLYSIPHPHVTTNTPLLCIRAVVGSGTLRCARSWCLRLLLHLLILPVSLRPKLRCPTTAAPVLQQLLWMLSRRR